jgi:hypothetical protein
VKRSIRSSRKVAQSLCSETTHEAVIGGLRLKSPLASAGVWGGERADVRQYGQHQEVQQAMEDRKLVRLEHGHEVTKFTF